MDIPNMISEYNLLVLSISDLICLSFRLYWGMSLAEVDHPLRFGVSLGWNLRNFMGLF